MLIVALAVCNEEKNIVYFLKQLLDEIKEFQYKIFICFNGCNDASEKRVNELIVQDNLRDIIILHSKKGKSFAQNAIANEIRKNPKYLEAPVLFIDSDVSIKEGSVKILFEELNRIPKLLLVGALTVPNKLELKLYRRFLYNMLNIRNLHIQSEIARQDVLNYKWYAQKYPQNGIDVEQEKKSKIFFHGRCFLIKNIGVYDVPDDPNLADDTYLPSSIHYRFGPGVIRNIYAAQVYYEPYISLRVHFRTYRRIFCDIRNLDKQVPYLALHRSKEKTKLDLQYIMRQKISIKFYFILYILFIKIERLIFRLMPTSEISKIWNK